VLSEIDDVAEGKGESFDFEYRIVTKAGRLKHLHEIGYATKDRDGNFLGLIGTVQDITELKRMQEAMEESEKLFRAAFENSAVGMTLIGPDSRLIRVNEAFCRLIGLTEGELTGLSFCEITHPDDVTACKIGFDALLDGEIRAFRTEKRYIRKDGAIVWADLNASPVRDAQGKMLYTITHVQDITNRKASEREASRLYDAVSAEKEKLSALINSIEDEIWFADTQKRYTLVNQAVLKEFNFDPEHCLDVEKLAARTEIFRPDGSIRPATETPALRTLKGEVVRNEEEIFRHPIRGDLLYRRVTSSPVRDASGAVVGSVSVVRDMTGDKKMKARLDMAEEQYHMLFETQIEGFCIIEVLFDPDDRPVDYRFLKVNPAFERQTGLHDVQGKRVSEIIENFDPIWAEVYGKVVLTGEPQHFEKQAIGLNRWFEEFVRRVGGPEDRTVAVLFNDITERKVMEDSLRENQNQLSAVFHNSPAPIFVTRLADGIYLDANEAYLQAIGYSKKEVIGHGTLAWDLWVNPAERKRILRLLRDQGRADNAEIRLRHKSGSILNFLFSAVNLERHGETCILGSMIDITQRKDMENALRERTEELEVANKELDSFAYSVSHDLQAPLRAIDGFSRMILKKQGDQFDEETRNRFGVIRDNARRMQQLIADLLAFSRLGRESLSVTEMDMDAIFREAWKELRAINADRRMTLKGGPLPPAIGDRGLIAQVVRNLLANAVKFAKIRDEIVVEVGAHRQEKEIVYTIKDNGIGFDMEYHDKLFGVFQRLHSAEEYEGTGIGLALVQRMIHRHGGRIWAEGAVNEGATFYFTLPVRAE
jgi:PAS domain S-box-containing protein